MKGAFVFGLLALAIPHAVAQVPIAIQFSTSGTAEMLGSTNATMHATGITLLPSSDRFEFEGTFRIVLKSSPRLAIQSDPLSGPGNLPGDDQTHETIEATKGVIAPRENATVIVVPRQVEDTLPIACIGQSLRLDLPVHQRTSFQAIFERPIQPLNTSFNATCANPELSTTGDMLILVYDADIDLPSRQMQTGPRQHAAQSTAFATVETSSQYYAVIIGSGKLSSLQSDAWVLGAARVDGVVNGTFLASGVTVSSSTPSLPGDVSLLQVDGNIEYALDAENAWLSGDASRIRVDGRAVPSSDNSIAEAVAIAVGVAGLLAVLHWLVIGYVRTTPLANETRREILALVTQGTGASISNLCQRVGVRRPTVYFHANILARAGLVMLHKRGTSWYVLPSTLPRQRATSSAAIHHPIRRAIHGVLQASGRSSAADLARAVSQRGLRITSSMMSYHLQILIHDGVLAKDQRKNRTYYSIRTDAAGLAIEQAAANEV